MSYSSQVHGLAWRRSGMCKPSPPLLALCLVALVARAAWGIDPGETAALLVVDVQQCFLPGGALPTLENPRLVPSINLLRRALSWRRVVFTQDWHPPNQ